jgi:hypothetical protein
MNAASRPRAAAHGLRCRWRACSIGWSERPDRDPPISIRWLNPAGPPSIDRVCFYFNPRTSQRWAPFQISWGPFLVCVSVPVPFPNFHFKISKNFQSVFFWRTRRSGKRWSPSIWRDPRCGGRCYRLGCGRCLVTVTRFNAPRRRAGPAWGLPNRACFGSFAATWYPHEDDRDRSIVCRRYCR